MRTAEVPCVLQRQYGNEPGGQGRRPDDIREVRPVRSTVEVCESRWREGAGAAEPSAGKADTDRS